MHARAGKKRHIAKPCNLVVKRPPIFKIGRPFYNQITRLCSVSLFPGPGVRRMGVTVYCRAKKG